MDFSSSGYMGGGVAVPDQVAPVQQVLDPSGGDDTVAIQAAIDAVSALPSVDGFRGMVLLNAGQFNISQPLKISTSGVVVSGSGSGDGGAVIALWESASRSGVSGCCLLLSAKLRIPAPEYVLQFVVQYLGSGL